MDVPDTGETEQVLGPKPESDTEEPERFPGGADSLEDERKYGELPEEPLPSDVPSRDNPATSEVPQAVSEGEDKQQEPSDEAATDEEPGA